MPGTHRSRDGINQCSLEALVNVNYTQFEEALNSLLTTHGLDNHICFKPYRTHVAKELHKLPFHVTGPVSH